MSIPFPPLPPIGGDVTKTECAAATAEALNTCFNKTGSICYEESNTIHQVKCTTAFGLGTGSETGNITCNNVTVADLCPSGHYCTLGEAYACPPGYFCPEGTADAYPCTFSHLSCRDSYTSDPNHGAIFIMLVLFFVLFAGLFRWYGRRQLENESHSEWAQIAINVTSNIYDAVNGIAMEHDQHAVMKTIVDIRKNIINREKKVSMGEAKFRGMEDGDVDDDKGPGALTTKKSVRRAESTSTSQNLQTQMDEEADDDELENEADNPEALQSATARVSMPRRLSMRSTLTRRSSLVAQDTNKLMGKLKASMAQYKYDEVAVPITIAFESMYLSLKANDAVVLTNISVAIKPHLVTAIMGPSGAGKTTLLALLRGHANYANIRGSLTINGHSVSSLEMFKHRIAYVPQDDIVSDELSVEENIMYSALLFNKRGYLTAEEVMPMVLRAETLLDISHIRTAVVGSAAKRGISGGQKKRVSIGMELMKEAELFFLDEPTSGLDSASSMLVVNALHFLASKGVNVCATIHQPRQEILNLMDNLLLLAPGGRVVYHGPIIDLHRHFANLHYTCPATTNIADYVMDTLCGFVPEDEAGGQVGDVQETIETVCDWWEQNKYPHFESAEHRDELAMLKKNTSLTELAGPMQLNKTIPREWRFKFPIQWLKVLHTCFDRQVRTNRRTFDSILVTCALMLVFGMVVAFLIGPVALDTSSSSISRLGSQVASGSLVFALLVQSASSRLFAADELLRDREFTSGLMAAPYFLGKICGNFADCFFHPFAFMVGYYPFLKARAPFTDYWGTFVMLHFAISAMVNFIVVAYPGTNKSTFCVGVVVLLWSFGGINPPLEVMKKSMSTVAVALNTMSPFKYSYELELINELSMYPSVWETDKLLDRFSYSTSDRSFDVGALFAYFFLANFAAYLAVEARMLLPGFCKELYDKYSLYLAALQVRATTNPGGKTLAEHQAEFERKQSVAASSKNGGNTFPAETVSPLSAKHTAGIEIEMK